MAADSPQYLTLTSAVVGTITLTQRYEFIDVVTVDGAAVVYFTTDGTDPVAKAAGTYVLMAVAGNKVRLQGPIAPTALKFLAVGTPTVGVRGMSEADALGV